MPRNGSGGYSLPAGNPVVSGSLVQASWANSTLADIAAALTNSLSSDGQTTPTANLPMGGFRFTNVGAATAAAHVPLASQVQSGAFNVVGTVAGGPTNYTGTLPLATVAFTAGQQIVFTPNITCADTPTLALNGGLAKFITDAAGTSLLAGMLVIGSTYVLIWDGANWRTSSGSGLYLPITGGELNGNLGIKGTPTVELDVFGSMRVQSNGTNFIYGDTGSAALYVTNPGAGHALEVAGTVEITGLDRALRANWSDASVANRTVLQTNVVNGNTVVPIAPNGTSVIAGVAAYNATDVNNASYVFLSANATDARLSTGATGAASQIPMRFYTAGVERITLNTTAEIDFPGTAVRLRADFSNATQASRALFQTTTANSNTSVGIVPNGSGAAAVLNVWAYADPTNSHYGQLRAGSDTSDVRLVSGAVGTGTAGPLRFFIGATDVGRWLTTGVFEADKGVKTTRSSSGVTYGYNHYVVWRDPNANANQGGWSVFSYKNGTSDLLYFMPLADANDGPTTNFINFERKAGSTEFYINLSAKLKDTNGTPALSSTVYHWLQKVEVAELVAQSYVTADTVAADAIAFEAVIAQSTSTTTHTIDFSASNYYKLTMGHNIATLTLTAPYGPCVVQLELVQDGGGGKTMTWPASLKWPANYTATDKLLSTAASARDLLILRWNGTDYVANLMKGIA